MNDKNKVVKFRKRKSFNFGIIIFIIMFLYIAINVFIYATKEQMSIYEVQEGSITEDNLLTGLILREEQIITSQEAGFISYFKKEGERVHKLAPVCAIDDSRDIFDMIMNGESTINLSKENIANLKADIRKLHRNFSGDNFSYVYDFREDTQNTVLELYNETMISFGQSVLEETGFTFSYHTMKSPYSGVVSYYFDNFENIKESNITKSMFNLDNYSRTSLRTNEMLTKDSPIFKLVTSDHWSIILPLSDKQVDKLIDREHIEFRILEDNFKTRAKLDLFQNGSETFAKLSLDNYMSKYLDFRFIELELSMKATNGLKVPISALVDKDFYLIPIDFFTVGGESGNTGVIKENYSELGEVSFQFVPTDIYYQDDIYAYVDTRLFDVGTWLHSATGSERFRISQMDRLTGVYNVNQGFAVFRRVEILYEGKDYCIVKKNTSNGLSVYDQIALDSSKAVEQAIIY